MPNKNAEETWYRLDNAARLYPAIRDTRDSTFRISVELKEEVRPELLKKAVSLTLPRFPVFNVRLKKGYFWYYLEYNGNIPPVEEEMYFPNGDIQSGSNNEFLFRVIYYKKRIAVEFFHSIADGLGAVEFLKTLVFEYLTLCGYKIDDEGLIKLVSDSPKAYESEDSFEKYYDGGKKKKRADREGYRIEGTPYKKGAQNIITGVIDTAKLLEISKGYGVTLTAFLASVFIYAIYKDQRLDLGTNKPIRIMIPKNLRGLFPSATLRNFISHFIVDMDIHGEVKFYEIVNHIGRQMKEFSTKEEMLSKINLNVDISKNIFIRIVPLYFKNIGIKAGYKLYGEKFYTTVLSNLAVIKLPRQMEEHVENIVCSMGATDMLPIKLVMSSYKEKTTLSFTRCIKESDIIKEFFRFLTINCGAQVSITGNGWGE